MLASAEHFWLREYVKLAVENELHFNFIRKIRSYY